jgi:Protein of unknown function (DUF2637)
MSSNNEGNDWFSRFGWAIVLSAALSMSAYSLFFVGRHLGMPVPFAAIVSVCFDGVAVLSADYSLRYARMGLTSTGPQLTVYLFGGLSAYLNTLHAYFGHEVSTAKILWAAPPIAAILVFEFHNRWARLSALRAANRIPDALPSLGRHSWVHHPVESFQTIRIISGERLHDTMAREAPNYVAREQAKIAAREALALEASHKRETELTEDERNEAKASKERKEDEDARRELAACASNADRVRVALRYAPEGSAKSYVAWLNERGIEGVSDVYVRQIRASAKSREASEKREGIHAV